MSEFLVFQQFDDIVEAEKIASKLESAGIRTQVQKVSAILDSNFIGTKYQPTVELKLAGPDFIKARDILLQHADINLDEVDPNYMLLSFSNDELLDIIAKPDEWGVYNYNIANALLRKRGINVSSQQKEQFEKERLAELGQQRSMNFFWIIAGYAIPAFNVIYVLVSYDAYISNNLTWLFPGIGGLIIAFILVYSKKTLPNGTSIPVYSHKYRKHGPILLKVNAIAWLANGIIFTVYHTFLSM